MTDERKTEKWYFRMSVLVAGFLVIGPFMLPLVWLNPGFDVRKKVLITIAVLILSVLLGVMLSRSIGSIEEYYKLLQQSM